MHLKCPICKEQSVKVIHLRKQGYRKYNNINNYSDLPNFAAGFSRSRNQRWLQGNLVCEKCDWRDEIR